MVVKKCLVYLGRSRRKSVGTNAFESSLQVRARPVSANIYVYLAFVLVHAFLSSRIQNVSSRTLTPVRSVRVYTFAPVTRVRHKVAFVQVFTLVSTANALRAQFCERVCVTDKLFENQFE